MGESPNSPACHDGNCSVHDGLPGVTPGGLLHRPEWSAAGAVADALGPGLIEAGLQPLEPFRPIGDETLDALQHPLG